MDTSNPTSVVEEHRALIERLAGSVCRRNGWGKEDREDFRQHIIHKLLDDDGAVVRNYSGKSTWTGYLAAVIANEFRDERIRRWGKWRPSAAAKRLGPLAVRLEQLLRRDGHTRDEATRILEMEKWGATVEELDEIEGQLPHRRPRPRSVEEEKAGFVHATVVSPERAAKERECRAQASKLQRVLNSAMGKLPKQDRLILRLKLQEGLSVVNIARQLGLEGKPLYRRVTRCLKDLKKELDLAGLTFENVQDLLTWEGFQLEVPYDAEGEQGSDAELLTPSPQRRERLDHGVG
ncbi:MAG: sigma-70 family RNA polymerase sigma factor [Acidobacteriota bacterium]